MKNCFLLASLARLSNSGGAQERLQNDRITICRTERRRREILASGRFDRICAIDLGAGHNNSA